jgi:hypothetical protein
MQIAHQIYRSLGSIFGHVVATNPHSPLREYPLEDSPELHIGHSIQQMN